MAQAYLCLPAQFSYLTSGTFLRGTFRAKFIPPAVPRYVSYATLLPTPSNDHGRPKPAQTQAKPSQFLTVPIQCPKDSPKATLWVVSSFHSFKAQLNPQAFDTKSGHVLSEVMYDSTRTICCYTKYGVETMLGRRNILN